MAKAAAAPAPLEGAALRAAMLQGVRRWALAGHGPALNVVQLEDLVDHQLAAIHGACTPKAPASRPPMRLASAESVEPPDPQLPWWNRDLQEGCSW